MGLVCDCCGTLLMIQLRTSEKCISGEDLLQFQHALRTDLAHLEDILRSGSPRRQ